MKNKGLEIKCDICGSKMKSNMEKCLFSWEGQEYHADVSVLSCSCGYRKLATCSAQFFMDDLAPEDVDTEDNPEGAEKLLETEDASDDGVVANVVLEIGSGKMPFPFGGGYFWSDAWLDYMLKKEWFASRWYDRIVSHDHRQERYIESHVPSYRTIRDNVLYDTEKAKMFFTEQTERLEKKKIPAFFGSETVVITKKYYYVTQNEQYFSITVRMGERDEMDVKSVSDIKRLLKDSPEVYAKVIHEKVENMDPPKDEEKPDVKEDIQKNKNSQGNKSGAEADKNSQNENRNGLGNDSSGNNGGNSGESNSNGKGDTSPKSANPNGRKVII